MLVNIRGTNGAGKTTAIRTLMELGSFRPVYGLVFGPYHPQAYVGTTPGSERQVFVLGRYDTPTGGCDSLPTYDLVIELLEKYAAKGNVIFEGFQVASCYGRIGAFMESYGKDAVMLFLDTPLETCLQRIEARSGKLRDARLIKNVSAKFKTIERIEARVREDNIIRAERVSDAAAAARIVRLLSENDPSAAHRDRRGQVYGDYNNLTYAPGR